MSYAIAEAKTKCGKCNELTSTRQRVETYEESKNVKETAVEALEEALHAKLAVSFRAYKESLNSSGDAKNEKKSLTGSCPCSDSEAVGWKSNYNKIIPTHIDKTFSPIEAEQSGFVVLDFGEEESSKPAPLKDVLGLMAIQWIKDCLQQNIFTVADSIVENVIEKFKIFRKNNEIQFAYEYSKYMINLHLKGKCPKKGSSTSEEYQVSKLFEMIKERLRTFKKLSELGLNLRTFIPVQKNGTVAFISRVYIENSTLLKKNLGYDKKKNDWSDIMSAYKTVVTRYVNKTFNVECDCIEPRSDDDQIIYVDLDVEVQNSGFLTIG